VKSRIATDSGSKDAIDDVKSVHIYALKITST
jgi:hypothetical protein